MHDRVEVGRRHEKRASRFPGQSRRGLGNGGHAAVVGDDNHGPDSRLYGCYDLPDPIVELGRVPVCLLDPARRLEIALPTGLPVIGPGIVPAGNDEDVDFGSPHRLSISEDEAGANDEGGSVQLYYTATSPYARVVRMVVIQRGLSALVDLIEARTRTPASPYYQVNASGRVPFLIRDCGQSMEDSQLICSYLDELGSGPKLNRAFSEDDWVYGRLETYARSFVDGVSVWAREMRRPAGERSPGILAHEADRALRIADFWEREISHGIMQGQINMAQLLLVAGLDFAQFNGMGDFRHERPALSAWAAHMHDFPAVKSTAPKI